LETFRITDALPAIVDRVEHVQFEGQTRAERNVFASWEPSPRWVLEANGNAVPRLDVGDVGIGFETAAIGSVDAVLRFETPDSHRIVAIAQGIGWIALVGLRRWLIGRERRDDRRTQAAAERVG